MSTLLPDNAAAQRSAALKSFLLLTAIAIHAAEFFIPRIPFFPWLKPGLANTVTVLWIVRFGMADALLATLLRIWIAAFYFGFSFITLSLSCSGAIAATLLMGSLWRLGGSRGVFGTVGISVCGALAHNCVQLLVVHLLLARSVALFYQLPVICAASLAFGSLVGILVPHLDTLLHTASPRTVIAASVANGKERTFYRNDVLGSVGVLLACVALLAFSQIAVLAGLAGAATVLVWLLQRSPLYTTFYPLRRFWILFAGIACIHLCFTPGTRVFAAGAITREGIHLTLQQWFRIWSWLQLSLILRRFNFHRITFSLLSKAFRGHRATLYAGLLALEYFPHAVAAVKNTIRIHPKKLFFHPVTCGRDVLRSGVTAIIAFASHGGDPSVE
jgi:heptaprenyl diphosphate synthase